MSSVGSSSEDEQDGFSVDVDDPYFNDPAHSPPASPSPPLPNTTPASTTAQSTSESRPPSAADKGKGKIPSQQDAEEAPASSESAQRASTREELSNLAAVDPYTVGRLVNLDPTPIDQLDTATKLMRAISLVQHQFELTPPAPAPGHAFDPYDTWTSQDSPSPSPSPSPRPTQASVELATRRLSVDSYTSLLALLSSALADVATSSSSRKATRQAQSRRAEYDLLLARLRLGLQLHAPQGSALFSSPLPPPGPRPPTPPLSSAFSSGDRETPLESAPLALDEERSRDISALFLENSRLALLKLQPPALPRPRPRPSSTSTSQGSASVTPSPISKLPPELLAMIFDLARKAAEERIDPPYHDPLLGDFGEGRYLHLALPPRRRAGAAGAADLVGSRTAAQKFTHSLALVCKHWRDTSRSVAYASLHIRRKTQLPKLLALLSSPGNLWATHIVSINAKVPPPLIDPAVAGSLRGGSRSSFRSQHLGGAYSNVTASWSGPSAGGSSKADDDDNPGALFSRLVSLSPNLQSLALTVVAPPYSAPFGGRHHGAEFLEPNILGTLSRIAGLTSLALGSCIDYEDLEILLLGLPLLEHLSLEGGFDDINGQGTVNSSVPHTAPLKTLIIGSSFNRDYTNITDVQLAFVVEPAVKTLIQLELTVMSLAGGAFGGLGQLGFGGGGGGGQVAPPCFASGLFADLLVRMGIEGQLQKLALRDMQTTAGVTPSLNAAPHGGTFDYALSHCTLLRELTIHFQHTGVGLLDALASSPALEALVFLGPPASTSAADLAGRIEGGTQFGNLRREAEDGSKPWLSQLDMDEQKKLLDVGWQRAAINQNRMSKRGAEKQLTDRNYNDDEEDDEGSEGGSFAVAPPEVIATRPIRGLPNRKPPSALPSAASSDQPKPLFGGTASAFPGFGPLSSPGSPTTTTTSSNPFAFSSSSFGASSTPPAPFTFNTSSPKANDPPNTFPGTATFSFPTPSAPPPALSYYMSLRALNLALVDALRAEIEKDAFVDLGGSSGLGKWKTRYEDARATIQHKYDEARGQATPKASNGTAAAVKTPIPIILTTPPPATPPPAPAKEPSPPPSATKFSLPTPPSTFSFGGAVVKPPSSTTSTSTPAPLGFVPSLPSGGTKSSDPSAFKFPASVSVPTSAPVETETEKPKEPVSAPLLKNKSATAPLAPSPLRFGESVSPPTSSPVKDEEPKKFSFGATFGAIAKGKEEPSPAPTPSATFGAGSTPAFSFGAAAPVTTASSTAVPTFSFGSAAPAPPATTAPTFTFGSSTTAAPPATTSSFSFGAPPASAAPPSTTAPTFSFGSPVPSAFPAPPVASPFNASSPFSFGSAVPSTPPAPSKFAPSSPPITSTFGGTSPTFGFGAALAAKPPLAGATPGFSFGSGVGGIPPAAPLMTTVGFEPTPAGASSNEGTPAPSENGDAVPTEETSGEPFGGRGAGEENENVLYSLPRAKVWVFLKDSWELKGVCKIEIKENEEEGWRRVLARNTTTGSVVMNFRLKPEMEFPAKADQPAFMYFMAPFETEIASYRLQVKTGAMRDELADALKANAK